MSILGKLSIIVEAQGVEKTKNDLLKLGSDLKKLNLDLDSSAKKSAVLQNIIKGNTADNAMSGYIGNLKLSNKSTLDLLQTMALLGNKSDIIQSKFKYLGTSLAEVFNRKSIDQIRKFYTLKDIDQRINDISSSMKKEGIKENLFAYPGEKKQPSIIQDLEAVRKSLEQKREQIKNEKLLFAKQILDTPAIKTIHPNTGLNKLLELGASGDFSVKNRFFTLASAFGSLIKEAYTFAFAVASVVVPALIKIGTEASQAAMKLESMEARFRAVKLGELLGKKGAGTEYASVQQIATSSAKDMLDYVKALAIPSTFTAQQLFESAQQMESFGLNAKRSLYIAAQLSEVFGGTQEELMMITRMMGRMAAGELPDARALGRFGMNKEMLFGGKADELTGEQLLTKFAEFIRIRYSTIYDQLGGTAEAKLATLTEKYQFGLAKIGEPINKAMGPVFEKLGDFIDKLERSGVLQEIGQSIADMITKLSQPEMVLAFQRVFFDIVGAVQAITFEIDKLVRQLLGAYYLFSNIAKIAVAIKTFGLSLFLQKAVPSPKEMFEGLKMILDPRNYVNMPGFLGGNAFDQANKMKEKFESVSTSPNAKQLKEPAGNFISDMSKVASETEKQTDKLDKIKDNTKNMSDELSLRKAALGGRGGPLNQLGMSPTQVAFAGNINMNKSAYTDPSLMNPISMLEKAIVEIVRRNDSKTFRRF